MSVEIVTAAFCAQYFANYEVQGSKGNVYTVTLNGGEGAPFCTCPAFKFSGGYGNQDCKHVKLVWDHACLANPQWKDPGPNDLAENGITMISHDDHTIPGDVCVGCGGPTVPVKIAI